MHGAHGLTVVDASGIAKLAVHCVICISDTHMPTTHTLLLIADLIGTFVFAIAVRLPLRGPDSISSVCWCFRTPQPIQAGSHATC